MRRAAATLTLGALIAGPGAAGPLCHDLKGLYTPCPETIGGARQQQAQPAAGDRRARAAARAPAAHDDRPVRPPLFATGPLCRDTKGLAIPCVL